MRTLAPSPGVPLPPRLDDRSYLDFVQGVRMHALGGLRDAAERTATKVLAQVDRPPTTFSELRRTLDPVPIVAMRERLLRSQQEMTWRAVRSGLAVEEHKLLAELETTKAEGPGRLQLDPHIELPEWYMAHDIHIQPGGYTGDPIGGFVYHHVVAMRQFGKDDDNSLRQSQVDLVPLPEDGRVEAVLDLASAVGSSAVALKRRFPTARVAGVDLSEPFLRYAHRRAVALGLDIDLYQRPAEDTGFEAASFDLVYAYILFHEVPRDVTERVVREVHRLLRPGGVFAVQDFRSRPPHGPFDYVDYMRSCDSEFNGEPFADGLAYGAFEDLLAGVFGEVSDVAGAPPALALRACRR